MIAAIVSYDNNYGIGFMGDLLFHCPEDMKHFKELTLYNTVIMGSNTYWSIQNRPLKNRYNIVISSKVDSMSSFDQVVESVADKVSFHTFDEVTWMLDIIKERDFENDNYFVIGGGKTYESLLDYCDVIYATEVDYEFENVDSYFPNFKKSQKWGIEESSEWFEHDGKKYRFCKYVRVKE